MVSTFLYTLVNWDNTNAESFTIHEHLHNCQIQLVRDFSKNYYILTMLS